MSNLMIVVARCLVLATTIAATVKEELKSPPYVHLRRFNIINNYVGIIIIMYFWRK